MPITLVVAILAALGAALSILIGARSNGKRALTKLEKLALCLCAAGFTSTAYQIWEDSKQSSLATHLKLAWESEQDATIERARLSIIFPSGTTTERDIAAHLANMSFYMTSSPTQSTKIGIQYSKADDAWQIQVGSRRPQRAEKILYGLPLFQDNRKFCWWSDTWEAPERVSFERQDAKFKDRALCALSIELPASELPIRRLRDLTSLQAVGIHLGAVPDQILCSGTCNDPIVALFLYTKDNRYDLSPLQRARPNFDRGPSGEKSISASGPGLLAQLQVLFQDRQGVSSREGQQFKMGVVDLATETKETITVLGTFEVFPSIPPSIEKHPDFLSRYGPNADWFVWERWCGYASKAELCNVSMVVTSKSTVPKR